MCFLVGLYGSFLCRICLKDFVGFFLVRDYLVLLSSRLLLILIFKGFDFCLVILDYTFIYK